MNLVIYADNLIEATWFRDLSPLLSSAVIKMIGTRGSNPERVDNLITYDRPDIILLYGGAPVLVLEKTSEVPTGHNVGQRVARLVRALEEGVPAIKFIPFDAMKHGEHAGRCHLNIRLLGAFEKMCVIHGTPIIAVNWPCDAAFELTDDETENVRISEIIHDVLIGGAPKAGVEFDRQRRANQDEYSTRLKKRPAYGRPPPSVQVVQTREWANTVSGSLHLETRQALYARDQSVIYTVGTTPKGSRRQDPYTGAQFIYDYLYCRTGPQVEAKRRNLVLHFPKVAMDRFLEANPNDPLRKSCNWYLTANVMLFSDSSILLRA